MCLVERDITWLAKILSSNISIGTSWVFMGYISVSKWTHFLIKSRFCRYGTCLDMFFIFKCDNWRILSYQAETDIIRRIDHNIRHFMRDFVNRIPWSLSSMFSHFEGTISSLETVSWQKYIFIFLSFIWTFSSSFNNVFTVL